MAAVWERTSGARPQDRNVRSGARVQNSRTAQSGARVQSGRNVRSGVRVQNSRNAQNGVRMQNSRTAQGGVHTRSAQGGGRVRSSGYIQGSAVRKLDVPEKIEKSPKKKSNNAARKNREKAEYMNPGYVLFLSIALLATGCILVGYIRLQSDITNSIKHIDSLERELNDLKLSNDEEYNRITSSIDLEEVRRIAIQELGMKYAEEGQIVVFESENNDYVKQMSPIPD